MVLWCPVAVLVFDRHCCTFHNLAVLNVGSMSKGTWYSADHHFGAEAITGHIGRKGAGWEREFESAGEMDAYMIDHWNEVVGHEDTVYYLGDFTLKSGKVFLKYLDRLVGRIKFVPGGHDLRWMKDLGIRPDDGRQDLPRPYQKHEVLPMLYFQHTQIVTKNYVPGGGLQNSKKQLLILCHYPFFTWESSHHGSWNLHGHSHGGLGKANRYLKLVAQPPSTLEDGNSIDVGVDAGWDFYPVHFSTIVDKLDR